MLLGYFITFHTYGTWLHGHESGSVDPGHNTTGTPMIAPDPRLLTRDRENLAHDPVVFTEGGRHVVDQVIRDHCRIRSWNLHALNVRTTHVHVVVSAPCPPERVMNEFKAWGTRRLRDAGIVPKHWSVWSRHGSTRWLNTPNSFKRACEYTLYEQ